MKYSWKDGTGPSKGFPDYCAAEESGYDIFIDNEGDIMLLDRERTLGETQELLWVVIAPLVEVITDSSVSYPVYPADKDLVLSNN